MGRRDSFTAPDVNCADGMPWPRNLNTVETFFCVHGFDALMDCEVALVFAGGSGEDEAEETLADAGEVVVVLHAVCGQGGGVNGDTEAVLYIEGVHARVIEGDGKHVVLDGCLGNGFNAAGVDDNLLEQYSSETVVVRMSDCRNGG